MDEAAPRGGEPRPRDGAAREAGRGVPGWAETLVLFLDDGLRIPGTELRVGADAVLGLLPVVGDASSALATLSLFGLAVQRGVPRAVLVRMALNVALDTLLGSVPLVGDAFDLVWKANRKNLALIERSTQPSARPAPRLGDRLFVAGVVLAVICLLALPIVLFAWLLHALLGSP